MPWFWGDKKDDDGDYSESDHDEEYSSEALDSEGELTDEEIGSPAAAKETIESNDYTESEDPPADDIEDKPSEDAELKTSFHDEHTDDDEVSLIESDGLHTEDEQYLKTSEEELDESSEDSTIDEEGDVDLLNTVDSPQIPVTVETVTEDDTDDDEPPYNKGGFEDDDHDADDELEHDDDDDEEEGVTSFWEKQSLLVLAAEHDRVDILKAILIDDDQDKNDLMSSGIPPLHISISFGSTNATQSLLRMGADPSIRPNVAEIKRQQASQPEDSKVEIPNMGRFDGISAWELAFGNEAYEEQKQSGAGKSWSLFGSSSDKTPSKEGAKDVVIAPVDMAPSKREGIRHAFTAEALRCIGGDEVERLGQLLDSGMPSSIDIGGKDLYGWAVEMGALHCEELLRPAEAAKHGTEVDTQETVDTPQKLPPTAPPGSVGKVLNRSRPGDEMTVPLLKNRLDELESLATALSTCLDNLAEEVSVCHGLLLMQGGASALATHVKSLKTLQEQKLTKLDNAHAEWQRSEEELRVLVASSGEVGQEVARLPPENLLPSNESDSNETKMELQAQITASEHKIRKLRASIADLSDENTREMEQVEQRGLSGGINLVRGLREELREIDFQLTETKNRSVTCRTKIGMIHSRSSTSPRPPTETTSPPVEKTTSTETAPSQEPPANEDTPEPSKEERVVEPMETTQTPASEEPNKPGDTLSRAEPPQVDTSPEPVVEENMERVASPFPGRVEAIPKAVPLPHNDDAKKPSEVITSGDSQAIALRAAGNRGYFTMDLWQVLLRIIGFDRDAVRRSTQLASGRGKKQQQENLMIV